jgi:hypothetical protein
MPKKMKKLTITVTPEVYRGLRKKIGPGKISRFIDRTVRPYVLNDAMEAAYRELAADELAEAEADEWAEGTAGSALHQSD